MANGLQVQTSVTINTDAQQEMIRLTASPTSGILKPPANTLNVNFEAEAYLPNPVLSYSWDFNGDGTAEVTGADSKVAAQYQEPGLYFPKLTITDTQGNVYSESTVVNVFAFEEMEAILGTKWDVMKSTLLSGDIETALNYFVAGSKDYYRQMFLEFGPEKINRIFAGISEVLFWFSGKWSTADFS